MRKLLLAILIILFLAITNGIYLFYKLWNSLGITFSDLAKRNVSVLCESIPLNYRIYILLYFILIVIIIAMAIIIKRFKSEKTLPKINFTKDAGAASRTDLDVLYEMLKHYKKIKIINIEKTFKVNFDVALEWSKILEDGNLAIID